jgi:hypothetical protein
MSRGVCVIGVGGSGQNALILLKERLVETYGKVPSSVVLLSLDTAAPEASMSVSGINLKVSGAQRIYVTDADRSDHGEVELVEEFLMQERKIIEEGRSDEFYPLVTDASRVKSVDQVLNEVALGQAPHFNDWVQAISNDLNGLPPANKNIAAGAGMYRPLGRMALFLNYREVYGQLATALKRLFQTDVLRGDKYNIFVTGSVAGGTGSGIFIDVLVIIRKILKEMERGGTRRSVSVSSFVVMPSAFQQQHSAKNIGNLRPNSYAALRELDRFQLTHALTRPTLVRYGPGVEDIEWVVSTLSDYVYLVDSTTNNPRHSAFPAIADFIAAKVTDARLPDGNPGGGGLMIENIENNFDAVLNNRALRKKYLGLNTFTYIVPINDIVRSLSFRYLAEMHKRLFAAPASQEQSAKIKQDARLRAKELFTQVRISTLNRHKAPEDTLVPALMRVVINATKVRDPKKILVDWVSLLQLLARNQDEYQEDYKAFQQSLAHIETALANTIEYSRLNDVKETFEDGATRLRRLSEDLMNTYLGPLRDEKDPQSRSGGHWDLRLDKYDQLREQFALVLDFAIRDELNRRAENGKLLPNRLVAARLLVENVRARLQEVARQMDASLTATNAPERYTRLLTRELKEAQTEMEESATDTFIPLIAERPLKKQKRFIEATTEYLRLELGLRTFAYVKRLLNIFGAEDAYEWKDDEGRAHKADSVVSRALTNLENWRQTLGEAHDVLEQAHTRHESGRRDKNQIEVRRYLTDKGYEDKIYKASKSALDKALQGKGEDDATYRIHWVPKIRPDYEENEPPLVWELDLAWIDKPGVGPVDIAIHFLQGARESIEPIVRKGVTIVKRLYELEDFKENPSKLTQALEQQVDKPLLAHSAQGALTMHKVLTFPYKGTQAAQKFAQEVANRWANIDRQRRVDARNTLEAGESAASLTTISFTGALAITEVQQFSVSEAAYRLKLSEIGRPLHVFPEEQQAVKFEQQTQTVFPHQATPRTLSPEVVISMANRQKLLVFAAACAYGVIRRDVVDKSAAKPSFEVFLFLPGEAGYTRKQLSHSALIEVPAGQQVKEGQQYLDALQQFCIVKTQRVGLGNSVAGLVIKSIEGELQKDPHAKLRPHEQVNPFSLSLSDIEKAIQEAKEKLGPTFNEIPDPEKRLQQNAEHCLQAIAEFKRNQVDKWLESADRQVQDLGILLALLLNELSLPLRELASE